LTKFLLHKVSRKYGLEISSQVQIGPGMYLGHPYNITVAEGTVIGRNVNLHKGCTIGRENRGSRAGVPTIGNRVYVGIGAVVVGGVTIGDDVMIAPNSFVNFDVPAHSIVVGNPATVHHREDATESYVNFLV
jgi:serine O-acetyltransferase